MAFLKFVDIMTGFMIVIGYMQSSSKASHILLPNVTVTIKVHLYYHIDNPSPRSPDSPSWGLDIRLKRSLFLVSDIDNNPDVRPSGTELAKIVLIPLSLTVGVQVRRSREKHTESSTVVEPF